MNERLAGLAFGAVIALPVWYWYATVFFGAREVGDPVEGHGVLMYSFGAVVVTAAAGAALVVAGCLIGMDRQFWNFTLVGAGAGLLLLGTLWYATERLEYDANGIRYRSWWGLSSRRYDYADMNQGLMLVPADNTGSIGGKRRQRIRIIYRTSDGGVVTLCRDTARNPLWYKASLHVIAASRKHSHAEGGPPG